MANEPIHLWKTVTACIARDGDGRTIDVFASLDRAVAWCRRRGNEQVFVWNSATVMTKPVERRVRTRRSSRRAQLNMTLTAEFSS